MSVFRAILCVLLPLVVLTGCVSVIRVRQRVFASHFTLVLSVIATALWTFSSWEFAVLSTHAQYVDLRSFGHNVLVLMVPQLIVLVPLALVWAAHRALSNEERPGSRKALRFGAHAGVALMIVASPLAALFSYGMDVMSTGPLTRLRNDHFWSGPKSGCDYECRNTNVFSSARDACMDACRGREERSRGQ